MFNQYLVEPSLPSRECGLKQAAADISQHYKHVAPLAGVWIETLLILRNGYYTRVAPLAGAWIETKLIMCNYVGQLVAPLAGAWIETA